MGEGVSRGDILQVRSGCVELSRVGLELGLGVRGERREGKGQNGVSGSHKLHSFLPACHFM